MGNRKPRLSAILLLGITTGCMVCEFFIPKNPLYMDLSSFSLPPGKEFWFGTDALGRDIFSMIWYGGRSSLVIGFASSLLSALIAVIYGAVSGMAPEWLDNLMMRFTEILLSVPELLLLIFFQAAFGQNNLMGMAVVIGITGWMTMAKVINTEIKQLKNSEYVLAAKALGAGFFSILWKHLTPGFFSSIMFMSIMNFRNAILAEATLSFMGMGLPLEIISWGSMLSQAGGALLTKAWWMILIPGIFLISTLFCMTNLGDYIEKRKNPRVSHLKI
ncbi:MAG: ABC transporter permease [Lachnospiraceae bacterium]